MQTACGRAIPRARGYIAGKRAYKRRIACSEDRRRREPACALHRAMRSRAPARSPVERIDRKGCAGSPNGLAPFLKTRTSGYSASSRFHLTARGRLPKSGGRGSAGGLERLDILSAFGNACKCQHRARARHSRTGSTRPSLPSRDAPNTRGGSGIYNLIPTRVKFFCVFFRAAYLAPLGNSTTPMVLSTIFKSRIRDMFLM